MTQDGGAGIGDRLQDALRLRLPHEVEAGQNIIGIVERTVSQDVGFNALKTRNFCPYLATGRDAAVRLASAPRPVAS